VLGEKEIAVAMLSKGKGDLPFKIELIS